MSFDQIAPGNVPLLQVETIFGKPAHSHITMSMRGQKLVVAVSGEQDCSNAAELLTACAAAVHDEGCDLVLDLSAVQFMSAATVDVIMSIHALVGAQAHTISVEDPSRCARRVLALCDVSFLITELRSTDEQMAPHGSNRHGSALGTWVEVPPLRPDVECDHLLSERSDLAALRKIASASRDPVTTFIRDGT